MSTQRSDIQWCFQCPLWGKIRLTPISQWHKIQYRPCFIKIYYVQDKGEVHSMHIFNSHRQVIEQMIANDSKERETLEWSRGGGAVTAGRYSSRSGWTLQTLLSVSPSHCHRHHTASSCSVPGSRPRVCTLRYIANLVQPPVSSHINTHQPNVNEPEL